MSKAKMYRRVLLVCCSVTAIMGAGIGASVSAALAASESGQAQSNGTASAIELRQLADLQRKQIAHRRNDLGISSDLEAFRVEHEPLPHDIARLNALIVSQQEQIEALGQRTPLQSDPKLTSIDSVDVAIAADVPDRAIDLVDIPMTSSDAGVVLVLPAHLVEQDQGKREAFDKALVETRSRQTTITAEADPLPVAARPEQHLKTPLGLIAESEVALFAAPATEPMMRMAEQMPPMVAQAVAHNAQPVAQLAATEYAVTNDSVPVEMAQAIPEEQVAEVAFAYYGSDTVPDAELNEIRAGFVTSSGLVLNIGVEFATLINGELVVQDFFSLDDALESGNPGLFATLITGDDGGTTEIVNMVTGEGGIATMITNTTDDVVIEQVTTVSISIPNHADVFDTVGGGNMFARGIQLPQQIIDMSVGAIAN